MDVKVVGIDLGKNCCSLVGLDASGAATLRRRPSGGGGGRGAPAELGAVPPEAVQEHRLWRATATLAFLKPLRWAIARPQLRRAESRLILTSTTFAAS